MVHIVAASSLHGAIATLPYLIKRELKPKVTTIPGLTFNPRAKPLKNLRNLLEKGCLKDVRDIIILHDVLNNTITKHPHSETQPETPQSLIETIRSFKDQLLAVLYCRRLGTADNYQLLKTSSVIVINVHYNLISKRKQSNSKLTRSISELHLKHKLELHFLEIIQRHQRSLRKLSRNHLPKRKKLSQKKTRALACAKLK